jgi:SnoaL-like protein
MSTSTIQDSALSDRASALIDAYYDSWSHGGDSFDERRLREILSPELLFQGPVAGTRVGVESFLRALSRISRSTRAFRLIEQIRGGNSAALLYECDLEEPPGTHRFAEFLRVENDRIQEIRIVFDATNWR